MDHTGEQHRVEIRVDARSGRAPMGESGIWGRTLTLVNNVWEDAGGIWYGNEKQMKVMRIDQREQIAKSKDQGLIYPLNVDLTIGGWLAMLENGEMSMPYFFQLREIDLGGFVWHRDLYNRQRVEKYLGGGGKMQAHPLWLEVKRIEDGIEARKRQEGLIR